jgi:hypothetical protein
LFGIDAVRRHAQEFGIGWFFGNSHGKR